MTRGITSFPHHFSSFSLLRPTKGIQNSESIRSSGLRILQKPCGSCRFSRASSWASERASTEASSVEQMTGGISATKSTTCDAKSLFVSVNQCRSKKGYCVQEKKYLGRHAQVVQSPRTVVLASSRRASIVQFAPRVTTPISALEEFDNTISKLVCLALGNILANPG